MYRKQQTRTRTRSTPQHAMRMTLVPPSSFAAAGAAGAGEVAGGVAGAGGGIFSPSTLYSNFNSVSPGLVPGSGTTTRFSLPFDKSTGYL